METIDNFDREILKLLQFDASQSLDDISDQVGLSRNDVCCGSGIESADRHDGRVCRIDLARNDCLQRHDHQRAHHDSIDRFMRARCMSSFAHNTN